MTVKIDELQAQAKDLGDRVAAATANLKQLEERTAAALAGANGMHAGVTSGSVEQKSLAMFGVGSVPQLLEVNVASPMYSHVPMEVKAFVLNLKRDIDLARWTAQLFHGAPSDKGDLENARDIARVKEMLEVGYGKHVDLKGRLKSFGSTTAGAGDEWVPTALSSNFIEEYELERKILGRCQSLIMPSNTYEHPIVNGVTKARRIAEGAAATDNNFGTGKLVFSSQKLVEYYIVPEELNEDSAPNMLAAGRAEVIAAQLRAMEDAIINGDDSATHMDSDITSAADAQKGWKGFRKLALANSAAATLDFNSGITTAKLDALLALMGKFGINPREVGIIVGVGGYNQMKALPEVTTVDKFGPMATILTGALAAWRGLPVLVSEFFREDLNASGVFDNTTKDNIGVLMVNFRRFWVGQRRPIRVRVQTDPRAEYDRTQLVSYQRAAFTGHAQSATEASVVYGINVTK